MKSSHLFIALFLSACAEESTTTSHDPPDQPDPYIECEQACWLSGHCHIVPGYYCEIADGSTVEFCYGPDGSMVSNLDACVPYSSAECAASQACTDWGNCSLNTNFPVCVPANSADCAASTYCEPPMSNCECCLTFTSNYCCRYDDPALRCDA